MKTINKDLEEELKNAIINEDIQFLDNYRNEYDINQKLASEDNDTLIDYAISYNKSKAYRFFLANNASLDNINDKGENIVHSIVYSGCPNRLLEVIKIKKVDLNHKSNDGTTPLILSVGLEHLDMFKLLIEFGADINLSDNDGNLPIHIASHYGNEEMVDILIKKGTYLFNKTSNGNLPLALAVNENHINIIHKLYKIMFCSMS
jgi:ankyrin repeat protein